MATVQGIYIALFGRPADPLGLQFYNGVTNNGQNLSGIQGLTGSAEYQGRFAGQSNVQIVNSIYQSLFARDADLGGLTFYVGELQAGRLTIEQIAIAIYDGATGADATILANKEAAANQFTASIDTGAEVIAYDASAIPVAQAYLAGVTADPATIPTQAETDAVIAQIEAGVGTPGQSFVLTDAIGEVVNGTANDDTFSAVIDGAASGNGTLNVGDTINGGAGTDTANLLVAVGGTLPAGATLNDVEIVNLTYAAGNLGALNSSTFGGVEQLWQIDNTNAASNFAAVTVGAGVTAGFRSTGNASSAVAAAATVTAAAGVTSTAVALDGVLTGSTITLAETTANGLSTVSVSGSVTGTPAVAAVPGNDGPDGLPGTADDVAPIPAVPAANTLTLGSTAADVDTLNVALTSNTTVVIGAFDDLNTFDASGSTGNLTVALGTPDELTSAAFGSGNDSVTLTTSALAAGTLAIDLGAGNDVLTINASSNAALTTVSITLGEGNDTVSVAALTNVTAEANFAADLVTITDFNAAQDVLDLSALNARDVLVNTELANIAAAATLEAALDIAASVTTAGQYSIFDYAGNAYVLNNVSGSTLANGDGVMEITGFSVAEITASNFIA